MAVIARLQPASISVRAALITEGWKWQELEAMSASAVLTSSLTGVTLPRFGWWEFSVTAPQNTTISVDGKSTTLSGAGTSLHYQNLVSSRTLMVGATVLAEHVGKDIFVTARPI